MVGLGGVNTDSCHPDSRRSQFEVAVAWKHQAERIEEVHARSRLFAKLFECRARLRSAGRCPFRKNSHGL